MTDDPDFNAGASSELDAVLKAHAALVRSAGIEVLVLLAVFVLGFVVSAWLKSVGVSRWIADGFFLVCLAVVGIRSYSRRGVVARLAESAARVQEARAGNPR